MNVSMLWVIALTACGSADVQSRGNSATAVGVMKTADLQQRRVAAGSSSETVKSLPTNYVRAFACDFDENAIVAWERYHKTPAGRAKRTGDLKPLRSLGFDRDAHDGDLESLGGKITAPPGLTILGLPVRFLGLNGMIGDANSMYVTTFAKGVAVSQVVRAARLEMDQKRYNRYKIRHYSRRIGSNPYTELSLDDEGGGNAELICQVQSTPD